MNAKEKWEQKHQDRLTTMAEPMPNERLKYLAPSLNGGTALDLACGLGGNSLFLAEGGYEVQAVDLSETAVKYVGEQAERRGLKVYPSVRDLTELKSLPFAKESFDLVVITYYLDRRLFPYVKSLLKDGGCFFMETYFDSPKAGTEKVSSQFRLKSNELLEHFNGWKVLYFEENDLEGRQTIFCWKDDRDCSCANRQ
ncbi:class I SAM-dependent methyltransferase [Neobacillus notoginsengisoli]|uniref:Class I SAM-dependent methyltransferase n=1 Tax=Neobacillus notoginsengisoli TaxID=1578198 RepID=A0A417YQ65_9BACI|nr:class I SAM-dependent methyltransferase [Neobacillus notoginsengisoli]RHW35728.1 class I SAM-dependent methyltransferase [Neobacillus notoginsengisoli]